MSCFPVVSAEYVPTQFTGGMTICTEVAMRGCKGKDNPIHICCCELL